MKRIKYSILMFIASLIAITSCTKDLDVTPIDPDDISSEKAYSKPEGYQQGLAKIYGLFSLTGDGIKADIAGAKDEGFTGFLRVFWNIQELTTDNAKCAWGDAGIDELNFGQLSADNQFVYYMYYRVMLSTTFMNEYLRQTTEDKVKSRGLGSIWTDVEKYRAEVRFLRAYVYWVGLDLFGNVPIITENDGIGTKLPVQKTRAEVFSFVEKELLEVQNQLVAPNSNTYGRIDKAAAWTLLAKLYLNAKVYTGTERYAEAYTYAKKVIDETSYSLQNSYANNFLADNDVNKSEIIWPIASDGTRTQSYGNVTFIMLSSTNSGDAVWKDAIGLKNGWNGNRATAKLGSLFGITDQASLVSCPDKRAMFKMLDNINMDNWKTFVSGLGVMKFKNIKSTGEVGSDPTGNFPDTDFPMMRLAEVYLMYAEAAVRGGGDVAPTIQYVNKLRERAFGNISHNVSGTDLKDLDFILAERNRELYYEGTRRTDLIRFGKFTSGDYLWPWKGGVKEGKAIADKYNLLPIPYQEIGANPNIKQNPGY
jgi:hypothetical protein